MRCIYTCIHTIAIKDVATVLYTDTVPLPFNDRPYSKTSTLRLVEALTRPKTPVAFYTQSDRQYCSRSDSDMNIKRILYCRSAVASLIAIAMQGGGGGGGTAVTPKQCPPTQTPFYKTPKGALTSAPQKRSPMRASLIAIAMQGGGGGGGTAVNPEQCPSTQTPVYKTPNEALTSPPKTEHL